MSGLSADDKEKLLIRVLSQGRGSVEYARDLLAIERSYRKAAYRQYTLWKYGKLGRGNRRILPSCVATMTRHTYPAPDGRYMGYRQS